MRRGNEEGAEAENREKAAQPLNAKAPWIVPEPKPVKPTEAAWIVIDAEPDDEAPDPSQPRATKPKARPRFRATSRRSMN